MIIFFLLLYGFLNELFYESLILNSKFINMGYGMNYLIILEGYSVIL